jgi:flagellar motor switch protein FliM
MQDSSLSPDEIEALLGGTEGAGQASRAPSAPEARPYDLASRPRSVREPIPALELVGMRFARGLRQALSAYLRAPVEVEAARTTVEAYETFVGGLPAHASADVLRVRPLQGGALLCFEPAMVFAAVEALFGGSPQAAAGAPAREFTPTEQRIVARLVGIACDEYRSAWQRLYPVELEPLRSEAGVAAARIASAADRVVVTRLGLRIGGAGGSLHLCIPYATLEPIRETLYAAAPGAEMQGDRRWLHRLSERIQDADVTLVAEFARATATIEELTSLKVGDFIELGLQETITAKIDDVPVFQCRYGVSNGRYAIRIQSYLTSAHTLPGGEHDR